MVVCGSNASRATEACSFRGHCPKCDCRISQRSLQIGELLVAGKVADHHHAKHTLPADAGLGNPTPPITGNQVYELQMASHEIIAGAEVLKTKIEDGDSQGHRHLELLAGLDPFSKI